MHARGDQAVSKAGQGNLGLIGLRGSQEVPSVVEGDIIINKPPPWRAAKPQWSQKKE